MSTAAPAADSPDSGFPPLQGKRIKITFLAKV
jgi:hypothetical protein